MAKVKEIKATGSLVLIELLKAEEIMESSLIISDSTKVEAPQAYVLDIGPNVDRKLWGVEVGDRIVFSGMMTPMPKCGEGTRQKGIIDLFSIKGILKE